MSFWDEVSDQMELFRILHKEIANIENASQELRALGEAIKRNRILMIRSMLDMNGVEQELLTESAKQLQTALNNYAAYVRANRNTIGEQEAIIAVQAMQNSKDYLSKTTKALAECLGTIRSDAPNLPEVDMDTIKEQGRLAVMRPSAENVSKEKIFAQILWLGENEALAKRVGQGEQFAASPIGRRLDVLVQGIERTEPGVQAEYAVLLARREQHLRRKVAQTLADARKRYEGRPDAEQQAMEAVVNDPYYREAISFYALRERLMEGPMEGIIRAVSDRYANREPDGPDLKALIDGGMHEALQGAPNGAEAERRAADSDLTALHASGVPLDDFALNLYRVNRRIAADKDKSPSTFYAIQQQLVNLAREDHTKTDSLVYGKRLRALELAAREYIRTHRTVPRTEKGKRRVEIANQVLELVEQQATAIRNTAAQNHHGRNPTQSRLDAARIRVGRNLALKSDYRVLARHQANIGTARINPPAPARREAIDDLDAAFNPGHRTLAHHLYTAFNFLTQITIGLPTNLVGMGMWFKRRFFPARQEQEPRRFDSEHVPGLPGEKYVEPEGDNIITDKRRIPLVFERPIPEDVNQPITLTLEVEQPIEGSAVSNLGMAREVGHTFLTMKYSKINPATGKMQRFQTSFGFYPMYNDAIRMMNSLSAGGSVEGLIMDDYGHSVSVGSTVQITPQQFNDIVRFAGEYEKGGYNLVSRNCTDFALDAIRHAKVDIPELEGLKKVDLTGLEVPGIAIGGAGIVLGSMLTHELAKGVTMRRSQQKANTYSRIGQNKASAEDVERTTAFSLNERVRGYTPGETAEHLRAHGAIDLHSKRYEGTERTKAAAYTSVLNQLPEQRRSEILAKDEDEREAELRKTHNGKFIVAAIKEEIPKMKDGLTKVYGRKNAEMTAIINQFDAFLQTSHKALEAYTDDALGRKDATPDTIKRLEDAGEQINEFITRLNRIYHESFKTDNRVNGMFQHMVSLAEQLRWECYAEYQGAVIGERNRFQKDPMSDKKVSVAEKQRMIMEERGVYDQNRAISTALYFADHNVVNFKVWHSDDLADVVNTTLTAKQLMGLIFAFDDPKDAMKKISKSNDEKLPKEVKNDYQMMANTLSQMSDAVEMLHNGHRFSEGELRRVFVDAPAALKQLGIRDNSILNPYYAMAVDGILGNDFFPELDDFIRQDILANRAQLENTAQEEFTRLKRELSDVVPAKATPEQRALIQRRNELAEQDFAFQNAQFEYSEALEQRVVEMFNQKLSQLPEEAKQQLKHLGELAADGEQKAERTDNPEITLTDAQRRSFGDEGMRNAIMKGYLAMRMMKAKRSLVPELPAEGANRNQPRNVENELLCKTFLCKDPCWTINDPISRWTPTVLNAPVVDNRPVAAQPQPEARQNQPARRNSMAAIRPKQEPKQEQKQDKPARRNSVL